ncbi:MAG: sulfatase-like hydrolase/transferase [Clostridiales bacterium]|nr:sulfatase-like hydrolase/transferase [Clostridiales bacterium]
MAKKENVILILTDQLRGDCVSIDGNESILTPNIDSIGGQGIRFPNSYSATPSSCIAARRTIMSGLLPQTHGMVGYKDYQEWDAITLPQILKDNGYQTYMVGRNIHLHPTRKRYGFDHMVVNEEYKEWVEERVKGVKFNQRSSRLHTDGIYYSTGIQCCDWTARPWPYEEYLHHTNWTVNEAIRFLERRDPSMPFFLAVSFLAPHPPLIPPEFYMNRYLRNEIPKPKIGDWETVPPRTGQDVSSFDVNLSPEALKSMQAGYYGLVNHIDDQLRRFLKIVDGNVQLKSNMSDSKGEDDKNTIIMFTSDHGEMLGDHYMRRKSVPYQGSIRIPFMMHAPERYGIDSGKVCNRLAGLQDIMPTVLDMLDIEIPEHIDGKSLVPLLTGDDENFRGYIHIEHAPRFHGIVTETDKFIWYVASGREQYFDLVNDPDELHNAINDREYKQRVDYLRDVLIDCLKD